MKFTDAVPRFPYCSTEASEKLGIPSEPVIHLAITDLAGRLLSLPVLPCLPADKLRIVALRCASEGVLKNSAWERIEADFRSWDHGPELETVCPIVSEQTEHNWLEKAAERLNKEGIQVDEHYRRWRTRYGWSKR